MSSSLLGAFDSLRRERELISKMLLTYGELEFVMLDMLGAVLRSRTHAVRTIYQLRNETSRIVVFEAIVAPAFEEVGLTVELKDGMDALNRCKSIRSQYAHCAWTPPKPESGTLRFANLERIAQTKGADTGMVVHPLSLKLLREQWAYFEYTDAMLLWLNQEYRLKVEKPIEGARISRPKKLPAPKLHSHGEEQWHLSMSVGRRRLLGELPVYRLP